MSSPHAKMASPLAKLRDHVSGAIARGEAQPIVEMRAANAPTRIPKDADGLAIASRLWTRKPRPVTYYVAQVPGEGGVDWGYTEKRSEAKPLSIYWQRRFRRDCERVGYGDSVQFHDVEVTDVMFRIDRSGKHRDVTAVFPGLPGSPGMLLCYAHVGQHGSASTEWVRGSTRPAKLLELQPLRRELESIGYKLRAVGRMTDAHRKQRRALGG